jgi:hypothetical protein
MGGSEDTELGSRRCMLLPTGVERIVKMKAILSRRRGRTRGCGQRAGSRSRRFGSCASTYGLREEIEGEMEI